ncbi:MAG: helix-turn-helix domain-containing protein [Steroidobacteraceae bacterium]
MLFLPLRAAQTFKIGRKAWQPSPSSAIFVASDHEYTAHAPAGAFLGLRVDGELLRREIAGRLMGRSQALMLKSVEIPIDAGRLAALEAIHQRMFTAANSPHAWGAYGNVEAFEAEAAAWFAGLVMEQAGVRAASPASLQQIERLERWLPAHLGENITLDRLCAVSGLGTRNLQKLFLARYGQSPLEWVTARRLAAARAQLLQAPAAVAISKVALDAGFTHLGRFSGAYRQAHGELPSATLAAARSRPVRYESSPA